MIADMSKASNLYIPTKYWSNHVNEIISEINSKGIDDFRSSSSKGIQAFGAYSYRPLYSYRPRFWRYFRLLHSTPCFNRLASIVQSEVEKGYRIAESQANYKMRLGYELIKSNVPEFFDDIEDRLVGGAESILINDKLYTETFLLKCIDYLDIVRHTTKNYNIQSILEIGAGFGGLAEIFLRKNKLLKYIIVDIPPVLAFSQWYLNQHFTGEVLSYDESRKMEKIDINSIDKRVIILAPWQIEDVVGPIDLFVNQASFQEMTKDVVENYATKIKSIGVKNIFIDNGKNDNHERPGLNREFYLQIFKPLNLENEWPNILHPGYTRLLLS